MVAGCDQRFQSASFTCGRLGDAEACPLVRVAGDSARTAGPARRRYGLCELHPGGKNRGAQSALMADGGPDPFEPRSGWAGVDLGGGVNKTGFGLRLSGFGNTG